jgi:predicted AAA+ superfamily ATPase
MFGVLIVPGKTLLFLDEIQMCIPAISSLRFFYEEMPELHVIAAGSLLEFALEELPSLGVGRIRSLFMYPLSFDEYLRAMGYTIEHNCFNGCIVNHIFKYYFITDRQFLFKFPITNKITTQTAVSSYSVSRQKNIKETEKIMFDSDNREDSQNRTSKL